MSKQTFARLPGFRDFLPEELAFREHILGAWRRVSARYGFQEYDGPPLEPLDLYVEKSGQEIVGQLYNFVVSPTNFERIHWLLVFTFNPDLVFQSLAEKRGGVDRRLFSNVIDAGREYFFQVFV